MAKKHTIAVTTIGDGSATAFGPRTSGKLSSIAYVKDTASAGANAYTNGVTAVVTLESSGEVLWTASAGSINANATVRPRAATHLVNTVAAANYAATFPVLDNVVIGSDRIKIVIASGGATKLGYWHVVYE